MYVRELKIKDFDSYYTMLIKCMTEKGLVDQSFNRDALNIEAKACLIRADHSVLGLFIDDELQGFVICMFGKNTYSEDIFCKIDLLHTSVGCREDYHVQALIDMVIALSQTQGAN